MVSFLKCFYFSSIEILEPPSLKLRGTVHVHKKLINAVAWHPHYTTTSSAGSPFKNLIATGSNESSINIMDLTSIIGLFNIKLVVMVTTSIKQKYLSDFDYISSLSDTKI